MLSEKQHELQRNHRAETSESTESRLLVFCLECHQPGHTDYDCRSVSL